VGNDRDIANRRAGVGRAHWEEAGNVCGAGDLAQEDCPPAAALDQGECPGGPALPVADVLL